MRVVLTLLVTTIALNGPSSADECSRAEMAQAKPHFTEGAKAFRIGELQKAADEFKAAYEGCPSPLFLYNLGQTYRQLKDDDKALYFYKQYLSTTPATDERRGDVEKWVAQLQMQIEARRRKAASAVSSTATPQTSAIEHAPATPAVATSPLAASIEKREVRDPRRIRRIGIGLIVAGGVIAGTGAGLAGYSASLYSQAKSASVLGDQQDLKSRSDIINAAAWPILGVGCATVVGGIIAVAFSYRHGATTVVQR